jgi:hypothetical protein
MEKDALKKMTVAELKDLAKKIPDVKGLSAMKKDDLVELLSKQEPAAEAAKPAKKAKTSKKEAPAEVATGPMDKGQIKRRIRDLKDEKREALSKRDHAKARNCNRMIHRFKHRLRKMAQAKPKKKKD